MEKRAYDPARVPRELVYWCIRKRVILEKLVRIVTASYENLITRVRIPFDDTEEFKIKVGLHQGSALSPLLFILVLDTLTNQLVILELQHLGSKFLLTKLHGALVRSAMLDNKEKGRKSAEKNGDANAEMNSRSVIKW